MSARNIVYKDWVMRYGKQKNKINTFRDCEKIYIKYRISEKTK
jgi:hypothetical protein